MAKVNVMISAIEELNRENELDPYIPVKLSRYTELVASESAFKEKFDNMQHAYWEARAKIRELETPATVGGN